MKQYITLLSDILSNGLYAKPARAGMPSTLELFGSQMEFDLSKGFPLLTTKRVQYKNILTELLWFLKGDTNIQYLVQNGCNIWNDDAYRYYLNTRNHLAANALTKLPEILSKEDFIQRVQAGHLEFHPNHEYKLGDLGSVYGHQWRNFGGIINIKGCTGFDQINFFVEEIIKNPSSRRHLVTAWNPIDFLALPQNAALPACHILFQCRVRIEHTPEGDKSYLDMLALQRSADIFLGVPYNIGSYATLLTIISDLTNHTPGKLLWTGGSVHLYENHIDQAKTQVGRYPLNLPELVCTAEYKEAVLKYRNGLMPLHEFWMALTPDMLQVANYEHHPAIKAPLSVGQ